MKKNVIVSLADTNYYPLLDELINSINSRLVSDQPIGLLLSTGIDSMLLLVILIKELKIDIKTFSFYESKDEYNINYLERISKYLNINSNIKRSKLLVNI